MATYVDVALEEIRSDYPQAYEILKFAIKPKYVPYEESFVCDANCGYHLTKLPSPSELTINSPNIIDTFKGLSEDSCTGVLTIDGISFKLIHLTPLTVEDHQANFIIEKIEKE